MPKIKGFNGEDRYNFLLALVGYLGHREEVAFEEVSAHFNLESEYILKALKSLNEATAQVGADLNVVDAQKNVLDEVKLRLKTTLSAVQDLDYTEAITRMNRDQLALEAAQSSFAKISKLSLFNYLN